MQRNSFSKNISHADALSTNRSYQSWLRKIYIYLFIESRVQARDFVTKIPVSTLFAMAIAVNF